MVYANGVVEKSRHGKAKEGGLVGIKGSITGIMLEERDLGTDVLNVTRDAIIIFKPAHSTKNPSNPHNMSSPPDNHKQPEKMHNNELSTHSEGDDMSKGILRSPLNRFILESTDDLSDIDLHVVDWKLPPTHHDYSCLLGPGGHSPIDETHECHDPSPLMHEMEETQDVGNWGVPVRSRNCCMSDGQEAETLSPNHPRHHQRRAAVGYVPTSAHSECKCLNSK